MTEPKKPVPPEPRMVNEGCLFQLLPFMCVVASFFLVLGVIFR